MLEERYGNRAGYVSPVKAAAERLVAQRLLLSGDVQRYVEWAEKNSAFPGPLAPGCVAIGRGPYNQAASAASNHGPLGNEPKSKRAGGSALVGRSGG